MQYFSSKILLFGEYSVVVGGSALAVPFPTYQGHFQFPIQKDKCKWKEQQVWSMLALKQFARAIEVLQSEKKLSLEIDLESFERDLKKHLFFDSNIPKGYGLGSSGAVVAGVVSRYGKESAEKIKSDSLEALQREFAVLESHFHGQSSGFDPLVCYLNRAVLKTSEGIQTIEIDLKQVGDVVLFLVDTRLQRETGPLVAYFLKRLEEELDFKTLCEVRLKKANNSCIRSFLEKRSSLLLAGFHKLSLIQFLNFQRMIPSHLKDYWEKGLKSGKYSLKLCGAGGGGCMLGIAKVEDWGFVEQTFGRANLKEVCRL